MGLFDQIYLDLQAKDKVTAQDAASRESVWPPAAPKVDDHTIESASLSPRVPASVHHPTFMSADNFFVADDIEPSDRISEVPLPAKSRSVSLQPEDSLGARIILAVADDTSEDGHQSTKLPDDALVGIQS